MTTLCWVTLLLQVSLTTTAWRAHVAQLHFSYWDFCKLEFSVEPKRWFMAKLWFYCWSCCGSSWLIAFGSGLLPACCKHTAEPFWLWTCYLLFEASGILASVLEPPWIAQKTLENSVPFLPTTGKLLLSLLHLEAHLLREFCCARSQPRGLAKPA